MVIGDFPELTFEEQNHIYRLNGSEIPSVTTLMRPLSDANYSGIDPAVLDMAAKRGTIVHNAIENYVQFGIEDVDAKYAGYFEGFKEWWNLVKPEPLKTEQKLYHKILRYAGKADLICLIDGRLTLVDYKTSAQVNRKLCAVQLEGYDRGLESHGIKIDDRLILHLTRDGYEQVRFPRSQKCYSVLSALITLHNYENE